MIRLKLDPQGDTANASLAKFLGRDRFELYRNACYAVGARWVPDEKVNRLPVGSIPQFLEELDKVGLAVEVDQSVADLLKEQAEEAKKLLDEGRARVEAANERLAESGLSLFRYQETGVEWLAPRQRALLCDEMGLGKTVQALIALPDDAAALAIVPAGVRYNWARECQRWRPDLCPVTIGSKKTFRYPAKGELIIATYGVLPPVDNLPTPPGTIHLIADEAHAVKNRRMETLEDGTRRIKTLRTRRFDALSKAILANGGTTWLLTGTPLLNRPPELWAVLEAADLATEAFGNWYSFCRVFNGRKGRYGYEWGQPTDEVPDILRRVSLHRRRTQVLADLPTKQRRDIEVNGLDAATIALCDEVMATIEAQEISAEDLLEKTQGTAFEQLSRARAALATAKIPALLEHVAEYEEAEEPLVVFSAHRAPIDALAKRDGWAVITGSTSADERGRIVEAFQNGELKGIAGTIQAMGVGVTLTYAHHAIMVDLAWTPALNCQAEDRLCRIGQDKGVFIYRLIARHDLDERVIELLTIKQEIIEKSIEASAVEADHIGASPAERLVETVEGLNGRLADLEAKAKEEAAQEERDAARRKAELLERLGDKHDGREIKISRNGKSRGPANEREAFAGEAILRLSALDPDRAREENQAGFSRNDGDFGHSLADQYRRWGTLSDKQWVAVERLVHKYRRQVGDLPVV